MARRKQKQRCATGLSKRAPCGPAQIFAGKMVMNWKNTAPIQRGPHATLENPRPVNLRLPFALQETPAF